jgi:lipoprotein
MKKLVFALGAVVMLSMVSCGKKETPAEKPAAEAAADSTAQEAAQPAVEEKAAEGVAGALSEVPKFSNEETQKFAEEYAAYYKEVLEAAKAKDAAKSAELAQKAQDLAKSAQEKMTKMTPEDAKVWGEWAQKIATEVAAAAQAQ